MPQDQCALPLEQDEIARGQHAALRREREKLLARRSEVRELVAAGKAEETELDKVEEDWFAFEAAKFGRQQDIEEAQRRRIEAEDRAKTRRRQRRFTITYPAPYDMRGEPLSIQAVYSAISLACISSRTGIAEVTNGQLAGRTGFSEAAVKRATRWLDLHGYIGKTVHRPRSRGGKPVSHPNTYMLLKTELLAHARAVFRKLVGRIKERVDRKGVSSELQLQGVINPVPTHPVETSGFSRSNADGKTERAAEGGAQDPDALHVAEASEEQIEATAPQEARPRKHEAADASAELEALDRLTVIALEEVGTALTRSPDRGTITKAVDRVRRAELPGLPEAEWHRLRGVHGRRADLALLEVVMLTEVRQGTVKGEQPPSHHKPIRKPVGYLLGILRRRRAACRPEVTVGKLLTHRKRVVPFEVERAMRRHAAGQPNMLDGLGQAFAA